MSDKLRHQVVTIEKYLKRPENQLCADCKRPNPTWASMNLGVFVCIKCSGCHREIGVHVTKIKSINLDLWPSKTLIDFGKINNKIANLYWEAGLKNFDFSKIRENDYRLQDFIRDKYEFKRWINKNMEDPMSLVLQGHDLIKEYETNGYPDIENYVNEDEEFYREQKPIVKKKQGKSFGIVSKKDDNDDNNNKNNFNNGNVNNNNNNNNNATLIDFGNDDHNDNNHNVKNGFSFINKSNSMKNNIKSNKSENIQKTSGFGFIKKTPIPSSNLLEDFTSKPNLELNFNINNNNNNNISNNNNNNNNIINMNNNNNQANLVDLFDVQTQNSEAVNNLSKNLMDAYNSKEEPNKPNYNIFNMNYPMNNFYNTNNNNIMMNNNMNMMNNNMNMMNNMNYQYQNNFQNNNYMMQQNAIKLELYNDPNKPNQIPSQSPFVYNIDLNARKKEDPFKNLVSFKQN